MTIHQRIRRRERQLRRAKMSVYATKADDALRKSSHASNTRLIMILRMTNAPSLCSPVMKVSFELRDSYLVLAKMPSLCHAKCKPLNSFHSVKQRSCQSQDIRLFNSEFLQRATKEPQKSCMLTQFGKSTYIDSDIKET